MNRSKVIISLLFALALCAVGCKRMDLVERRAQLKINVYVPDVIRAKAETGEIASLEAESEVKKLQIWVFETGTANLVGYLAPNLSSSYFGRGTRNTFAMDLPARYTERSARPNVDLYVIANPDGAGIELDEAATPTQLKAAVISGNYFGINTLTSAVPDGGLPMSGLLENAPMEGTFPVLTVSTVKLTRAVSKLRFVFSQLGDADHSPLDATFKITGIHLDGQIAEEEKLLTDKTFSGTPAHIYGTKLFDINGYVTLNKDIDLGAGLAPAGTEDPLDYVYEEGTAAQTYEDLINNAVEEGALSQAGLTYLRETDKKISGTISYSVGGETKTATFTMKDDGDFTRNHSWIVYAYFLGGKLYIRPTIQPWEIASTYNFESKATANAQQVETYRLFDADGNSSTWDDQYILVSYGYQTADLQPYSGTPNENILPRYNTRLEVVSTSMSGIGLELHLDNTNFKFVSYDLRTNTYNHSLDDVLELPAGENVTSYFYVVPKTQLPSTVSDEDRVCHVYVTTVGTGVAAVKIPFANGMPGGTQDSSEIWFYYTTPDAYPTSGTEVPYTP